MGVENRVSVTEVLGVLVVLSHSLGGCRFLCHGTLYCSQLGWGGLVRLIFVHYTPYEQHSFINGKNPKPSHYWNFAKMSQENRARVGKEPTQAAGALVRLGDICGFLPTENCQVQSDRQPYKRADCTVAKYS